MARMGHSEFTYWLALYQLEAEELEEKRKQQQTR